MNTKNKQKKCWQARLIETLTLSCLICFFLASCAPQILNPANIRANPQKFSFEDLKDMSSPDFAQFFKELIPVGYPRSDVENMLVHAGRATFTPCFTQQKTHDTCADYHHRSMSLTSSIRTDLRVLINYDENNRVATVRAWSGLTGL